MNTLPNPDSRTGDLAADVNILGLDYTHVTIPDKGDLYLTRHGLPFQELLRPENWLEGSWFDEKREPLEGTSTIYRMPTRPVNGRSKDIVVKWCRVGERVPIDTMTLNAFVEAEFNSPYEEFSLVMEMRNGRVAPMIRTHKPLAIYVPLKRFELWQTGRSKSRMAKKRAKYRDVELDIYRQYILIYEWVKGLSIVEACQEGLVPEEEHKQMLSDMTAMASDDLRERGFRVLDMKPQHVIVRPRKDGTFLAAKDGKPAYALVDFELLARTPEHEQEVTELRRADYLVKQRDRFKHSPAETFPPHLVPASHFDVDYVYGHTESTNGFLWVVGRDPSLLDYFQPERWRRTPREKLSETNEVYYTHTKDNIHLVWKLSRVGERPEIPLDHPRRDEILAFGYNSPFEEFALTFELGERGVPTTYPRAIYMTGLEAEDTEYAPDQSRYLSHRGQLAPDGKPILRHNHNYIKVWGYWNGLDELLARENVAYCQSINALEAQRRGFITLRQQQEILERAAHTLDSAGFEDLDLNAAHILLSVKQNGTLFHDDDGLCTIRFCNFGLMRRKPT
jgi:hypothetical protein